MRLELRFTALSDVGRVRKDNQDSGYAGPHLLAVADGVGGAARGDIASSAVIEQLRRLDVPPGNDVLPVLGEAIHRSHDRLTDLVEASPELDGTSSTLTAIVFDGSRIGVGHVGDSRGYLLREGTISQLTKDHTFVQSLIDEGRITEDEARVHPHRNLILRAVDGVRDPEPDLFTVEVAPGDRILVCSDGCSGVLDSPALLRLAGQGTVDFAAVELVGAALEAGSSDNVTVVLADVIDAADAADVGAGAGPGVEDETHAASVTGPMLVGAAADQPRMPAPLQRVGDTGELEAVPAGSRWLRPHPGQDPLDPESLRYAPRAPRRLVWLRRTGILAVAVALLAAIAVGAYAWSQTQYYVADSGGRVAIFKGVEADVPGVRMHHVSRPTAITLDTLPSYRARQVRDGLGADDLADAQRIVRTLRDVVVCPQPESGPTLTPTPTPTPSGPSAPTTPRKGRTRTAQPTPTPTPTPTVRLSADADGSCPAVVSR